MNGYQRELIVEIGPFQEWEGVSIRNDPNIRLVSNGNIDSFKIKVRIQKNKLSIPNMSTIEIWNLKRQTRQSLKTAGLSIKVYAGYEYGSKELLYTGSIEGVITQRQGTDIVTNLVCFTGTNSLLRSVVSKTYEKNIPLKQIVTEIAQEIPGVIVDPKNITLTGYAGYNGWSFVGSTKHALDKLADQFGFSWSINNGIFMATMDGKPIKTNILLDEKSGLMNVSPRLSGPEQIQEGVDITCLYRQNIQPGHLIRVDSKISPELSGTYECHTIEYDLCPKENNWTMEIQFFNMLAVDQ